MDAPRHTSRGPQMGQVETMEKSRTDQRQQAKIIRVLRVAQESYLFSSSIIAAIHLCHGNSGTIYDGT